MNAEPSLLSFILNAGFVVKCVILILLLASTTSWMLIVQRSLLLFKTKRAAKEFEQLFWSGIELNQLYDELKTDADSNELSGLSNIYYQGFTEYKRLHQQNGIDPTAVLEGTQRAMRVAATQQLDELEDNLSLLATIGSTSPYVGLFGTVWGIMTSFRALGTAQQATIAMVAPGISEALIATAIGLFAAIPAVIAYNRFSNEVERMAIYYDTFQDELTGILHRQAHSEFAIMQQAEQPA